MKIEPIRPGKPVENCCIESADGSFGDESLDHHWFTGLTDAPRTIERQRRNYDRVRSLSSQDVFTPKKLV